MLSVFKKALFHLGTIGNSLPIFIHRLVIVPQAVEGVVCVAHAMIPDEAVTSESCVIHVCQFAPIVPRRGVCDTPNELSR